MASLRDIKRRINSVRSTQKITRAMKMVAASRLRRAQEAIVQARPYAYHLQQMVTNLVARADAGAHPLLRPAAGGKVGLIVITSDRGLCGGYNSGIISFALNKLRTTFDGREVDITVVGRKGVDAFRRRKVEVRKTFTSINERPNLKQAGEIVDDLVTSYANRGLDEVYVVYNAFRSAVQQSVTLERLLPYESSGEGVVMTDYLYEPSPGEILGEVLVRNMRVQMHRILLEAAASEFGARMTAMDSATRNAGEVISRLTLKYNRARQDAITKELIEVISGAEAL